MSEETEQHLFMLCQAPVPTGGKLPAGHHVRRCRPDEVRDWAALQFDSAEEFETYGSMMIEYFDRVYADRAELFFERCMFACDVDDRAVGTAFVWPIRQGIETFHWFKVARASEGLGIGRALIDHVIASVHCSAYPVLLHTHPTSQRAIKLYSDAGFDLVTDRRVGSRPNDLDTCRAYLRQTMPESVVEELRYTQLPTELVERLSEEVDAEF